MIRRRSDTFWDVVFGMAAGFAFVLLAWMVTPLKASEQTVTSQRLINNATATATARALMSSPANCRETAIYVQWATGVTSGVVTVETAVDQNYTGTWAPLQVVTFAGTAPKEDVVQITGVHWAIGTRISTVVAGGGAPGVTTWAVCN